MKDMVMDLAPVQALPHVTVAGVPVHAISADGVEELLARYAGDGAHHQIATVNADFLAVARREPEFRRLLHEIDLVVPDGAPVLWAARRQGARALTSRVTGPDLIRMAVRHAVAHGSSLYFLGGAPGVAARAAERLQTEHGAFRIAGISSAAAGEDAAADRRLAEEVAAAHADFVFVGFGCPKQDLWIRRNRDLLRAVCVGVGGSFNYLSGDIRRAPLWAQRAGCEWLYRLAAEPRRLAGRYLIDDLPVVTALLFESLRAPGPRGSV